MLDGGFPILSALILWPAIAACVVLGLRQTRTIRLVALAASLVELGGSALLLVWFDADSARPQFTERYSWIPSIGADYLVAVDGLSVAFPLMTSLLTTSVILASWTAIDSLRRLFFALLLLLESITVGTFCAMDLALFFLFWEMSPIPLYFLIGLWGTGPRRRVAASQYTLMMLAGGVLILFGIVLLAISHAEVQGAPLPSGLTFGYHALLSSDVGADVESAIFWLLVLGFAIKTPLFPFHTWLPMAAAEGSAGAIALLTGIKLGVYGLLRVALPLAPHAAVRYGWLLAALGLIGGLYGALLALRQTNFKRLLAYASISHVGLAVAALAALNVTALQGTLLQMLNFSLVSGGLFIIAGFMHQRLGSTEMTGIGGLLRPMPLLGSFLFMLGLASIGVPGTSSFVGEFMMLAGMFDLNAGFALAALPTLILSAAYFLGFYRRAFLGPTIPPTHQDHADLRPRELIVVSVLTACSIVLGLFPNLAIRLSDTSSLTWIKRIGGGYPDHPSAFASAIPADEYETGEAKGSEVVNRRSY
ncbi:MAG: NADH-quinone oxidoreductase subunit M [Methylotetracoccus sp.]